MDYIPPRDADALLWMQNFRDIAVSSSAIYSFSSADVAAITSVVDSFQAALSVSSSPLTKTQATVAAKSDARKTAEDLLRQYAIEIKFNEGISSDDKIAIGVRPVNTNREPIEVPQSSPLLSIIGNTPGSQTLRYSDTTTPDSRARPFGASELQLFVAIGDAETNPLSEAQFIGKYTRNPIGVEFGAEDDGKVATYYCRWASPRGDTGPWSVPISLRIAA